MKRMEEESKQSEEDERKKCQLDGSNILTKPLSASYMVSGRNAFQKDFEIRSFIGEVRKISCPT